MVIALSGRAGSGKDTVGEIVQYLTSDMCRIDNFTFQEWLNYGKTKEQYEHKWEIKKFAGKLKAVGSLLTGIPIEMFEDQEFKKTDLPNEWVYIENGYAARNMTVRDFLQKLGTEAMRDGLHENVWVNALFADYRTDFEAKSAEEWGKDLANNWIITDMRFPNEMEAVELREGITIRVERNEMYSFQSMLLSHSSETALDDAKFDYVIENDGTLDELVEKVREILTKEKMI